MGIYAIIIGKLMFTLSIQSGDIKTTKVEAMMTKI